VHCFWPFSKMHKVRRFHFALTIYFYRQIRRILLKKMQLLFALSQAQWKAQAIACLIAFTFTLLQCLINASGSLITFLRFSSPIPEGGFKSSEPVMQQPHAESYTDSWFCYLWNITGSNPFRRGGEIPKEFEAPTCGSFFVPFGWFRLHPAMAIRTQHAPPNVLTFKSNASEYP
jgi:hypothetical protein